MKWIGRCLLPCLLLMQAVCYGDSLSGDGGKEKVELIQNEIAYSRYIIFKAKSGHLDNFDALMWVDAILEVIEVQLEEIYDPTI